MIISFRIPQTQIDFADVGLADVVLEPTLSLPHVRYAIEQAPIGSTLFSFSDPLPSTTT
jgi:hypothetical protein